MRPDNLSGQVRTTSPEIRTDNTPPLRGVRPASGPRGDEPVGVQKAPTASRSQPSGSPVTVAPRLVNMRQGAVILGCSFWTFRDYLSAVEREEITGLRVPANVKRESWRFPDRCCAPLIERL